MRSGNGKHRRPRQAPAIVVAAGVTGAGIALPLLGATGAGAADTATWDRVADCESGGVWSSNSGNDSYGGLALSLDAWQLYGGTDHAPRPDLASRSQQIAIAELILAERGPVAWSGCAKTAGLTEGGASPDINPGDTSDSGDTSGTGDADAGRGHDGSTKHPRPDSSRHTPTPTPDTKPTPDASTPTGGAPGEAEPTEVPRHTLDPTKGASSDTGRGESGRETPRETPDGAPSGTPGGTPSGEQRPDDSGQHDENDGDGSEDDTAGGKHRGEPRPEPGSADPETEGPDGATPRPDGRHADRGERGRDDVSRPGGAAESEHRVRSGDTLSGIAEQHETPGGWPALYEANEGIIGADPDLILPGQELDLRAGAKR